MFLRRKPLECFFQIVNGGNERIGANADLSGVGTKSLNVSRGSRRHCASTMFIIT